MGRFSKVSLSFGIMILSLFGCGKGSGGDPAGPSNYVSNRPANCAFKYDDGKDAKTDLLKRNKIEETGFDKKFSGNVLEAVSLASGRQTVSAIEETGASVFKATGEACEFFRELPLVSGKDAKLWQEVTNDMRNEDPTSKAYLAGLYPGYEGTVDGRLTAIHHIIVRDDSSRYTLLHEMMHYLFHKYSFEKGEGHSVIGRRYWQAEGDLKNSWATFNQEPTGKAFLAIIANFKKVSELEHESNKRKALEEATVEATLQTRFVKREIGFVPKDEATSSWYLKKNIETARALYAEIRGDLDKLSQQTQQSIAQNAAMRDKTAKELAELVVDSDDKAKEKQRLEEIQLDLQTDKRSWEGAPAKLAEIDRWIASIEAEIQSVISDAEKRENGIIDPSNLLGHLVRVGNTLAARPIPTSVCPYGEAVIHGAAWSRVGNEL